MHQYDVEELTGHAHLCFSEHNDIWYSIATYRAPLVNTKI